MLGEWGNIMALCKDMISIGVGGEMSLQLRLQLLSQSQWWQEASHSRSETDSEEGEPDGYQ